MIKNTDILWWKLHEKMLYKMCLKYECFIRKHNQIGIPVENNIQTVVILISKTDDKFTITSIVTLDEELKVDLEMKHINDILDLCETCLKYDESIELRLNAFIKTINT